MILAVAAAVGGMALSYQQTIQEGKDAAELAKIQQQQLDAQAKSVDEAGQFESREKRKEGKRAIASQIAQMSANGGQITGSNLAIVANTAKVFEGDALFTSGILNPGSSLIEMKANLTNTGNVIAHSTEDWLYQQTSNDTLDFNTDTINDLSLGDDDLVIVTLKGNFFVDGIWFIKEDGEVNITAGDSIEVDAINWGGLGGTEIILRSTIAASTWGLDVNEVSPAVTFVDVKDSDASAGNNVTATSSIDSGNNTNWTIS